MAQILPPNPLFPQPTGKLAIPSNPLAAKLASGGLLPSPAVTPVRPTHPLPIPELAAKTESASRAGNVAYNKASGGTQGVVPGIKAEDLKAIRVQAAKHPQQAALAGSLANPIEWGVQAAKGVPQIIHGAEKAAHGNLSGGGAEAGLGALSVAGVLPFGKVGEAIGLAARAGRTADETAAHIAEASNNAVAEGHLPNAGGVGQIPRLRPGEVTAETGGKSGASVRQALRPDTKGMGAYEKVGATIDQPLSASQALKAQKSLYNKGRTEQVSAGLAAREAAGGGLAGHIAERAAQAGALPKVPFHNGLQSLDQPTLEGLFRHAQTTPALRPFEQGGAVDALIKLSQGNLPTKSEQVLLDRAFGRETAAGLRNIPRSEWKTLAVDVLNVPRALMASTDLSAPFRQGLFALVSHPVMGSKSFVPMMRAAFSEKYFQEGIMGAIHDSIYYPLAKKAGLSITDIGKSAGGALSLGGREEQAMSNLAERIPAIGRIVRGSDRAYTGFLDKLRMDYFSRLVADAARQGHDVNDERLLTDIAKVVNQATGRGNIPKQLQDHLATMNALFFAPRLMASRINMLNPVYYVRLDPFARREALRNFVAMGGTAYTILQLAKMAGAQVNTDPTNADFAKIKLGNTRIDFLGGEQQYVRLAAQLYENKITSSTTGKVIPLGSGFAKTSRYDVTMKFLQGKLSPVPAIVVNTMQGKDFTGTPVRWSQLSTYERAAANYMIPFLAQDLYSLYTTSGPNGLLVGPLDLFGVGVQSYKAKTPSTVNWGGSNGTPGFGSGADFGSPGGFGSSGSFGG